MHLWRTFPRTASAVLEFNIFCRGGSSISVNLVDGAIGGWGTYQIAFENGQVRILGPGADTTLMSYATDTWYLVRRYVNVTANDGYVYVEEVGNPQNNATFSIGEADDLSGIDQIDIWTSGGGTADCYLDNVRVLGPASHSSYVYGSTVVVLTTPREGYRFVSWTGTGVDAGKVANPYAANTTVTIDADYTLHANYEFIPPER